MPFRFLTQEKHHRQPSLFGEILDWMLAPLLILWPLSMVLEYSLATSVANAAYDRELGDAVTVISRNLTWNEDRLHLDLRDAARQLLLTGAETESAFQVRGAKDEILDGDRDLSSVEFQIDQEPNRVYLRDDVLRHHEVRVAYVFAQVRGMPGAVLVQVAETHQKRTWLASKVIGGLLAAQFVLVPVALLMVWFGLSKGIEPLNEITAAVRSRKPSDLSPIDPLEAPEEVRPFVHSINDLMARLEQSFGAQQRFVADAAHQMRTPIAGLKTQAELAMRQRDPQSIQHAMRQIANAADRATRLINQLLALARTEANAPSVFARTDLCAVARAATRDWAGRAADRHIDLGFEGGNQQIYIDGDEILLGEMLSNLLDNAIRYTREGGKVTTRVYTTDIAVLEIEDNGIGIDPAERERVFERFYRALGTETEGTGLGLAIVRGIAQSHHASVSVLTNPIERGTCVRVSFPRSRAEAISLRQVA
jgi:two-component system sensor histidine kinase TctE